MIVNNESERIWMELVITSFKELFLILLGGTVHNREML
jgi:hypothetical protein